MPKKHQKVWSKVWLTAGVGTIVSTYAFSKHDPQRDGIRFAGFVFGTTFIIEGARMRQLSKRPHNHWR